MLTVVMLELVRETILAGDTSCSKVIPYLWKLGKKRVTLRIQVNSLHHIIHGLLWQIASGVARAGGGEWRCSGVIPRQIYQILEL